MGLFRASQSRDAVIVLLLAFYGLGLAQVAALPPFEGFDETGHYSYVRQLAATGTWPRRNDPMAAEVEDYVSVAPTPPALHGHRTYADLEQASGGEKAAARAAARSPAFAGDWRAGTGANWEAQHPPLYYLLLVPAYRLAADWSLADRLLLLRSISYTLAWCGLCLAAHAAASIRRPDGRTDIAAAVAPVLWPVLLPMWLPEMARLGNDSLLVPLACLAWLGLRRILADGTARSAAALGLVLGLGLLTKATFLPLAAAIGLLLVARCCTARAEARRSRLSGAILCGTVTLIVAGWWYLGQLLATGDPIGANDSINLARTGGLGHGLRQHASVDAVLRMFGTFDLSLVWDGTWSFVIPPLVSIAPMMAGVPTLVGLGLRRRLRTLGWLDAVTPLTLALFSAALVYYSLVFIASGGGGEPAWYMHAFVPVFWPLLAWGLAAAFSKPALKIGVAVLIVYAATFIVVVCLCDAALYAGCAIPSASGRSFDIVQAVSCYGDPARVADGLGRLAHPLLAAWLFGAGVVLLAAGTAKVLRLIVSRRDRGLTGWSESPAFP